MSISQNSKVLASDIANIKTNLSNAYQKTKGSGYTWANSISAGTRLTASHFSEIHNIITTANSSYVTVGCGAHYAHQTCPSNKSNTDFRSGCNGRSGYTNDKCGGRWY